MRSLNGPRVLGSHSPFMCLECGDWSIHLILRGFGCAIALFEQLFSLSSSIGRGSQSLHQFCISMWWKHHLSSEFCRTLKVNTVTTLSETFVSMKQQKSLLPSHLCLEELDLWLLPCCFTTLLNPPDAPSNDCFPGACVKYRLYPILLFTILWKKDGKF